MGANVQVCWEKFCRYWDVETHLVPVEGDRYHLTPGPAVEHCDENTIGVVAVLGSTFEGSYEPIADISERLRDRGWLVPAYTFPENRHDLAALRIVIRNGVSHDPADLLIADLRRHLTYLDALPARPFPDPPAPTGSTIEPRG